MEEQIKNNILIAEFLGGTVESWEAEDRLGNDTENDAYYVYFPDLAEGIAVEDLDYHEDWNSLMEVVETIKHLKETEGCGKGTSMVTSFEIKDNSVTIAYGNNDFYDNIYIPHTDNGKYFEVYNCKNNQKEAVYAACIKFIKWFNNEIK